MMTDRQTDISQKLRVPTDTVYSTIGLCVLAQSADSLRKSRQNFWHFQRSRSGHWHRPCSFKGRNPL